ncbi:Core histone macro-H2A.1 [Nymphon striatum]|nr:Core histone macro-H2A.1 [Nymphon striatum]
MSKKKPTSTTGIGASSIKYHPSSPAPTKVKKLLPKMQNVTPTKKPKKVLKAVAAKDRKVDVKVNKPNISITILKEKTLFLGQKLTVIQGDLVDIVADGIVHPTNGSFDMRGEVGQALQKAGGQEFIDEVEKLKSTNGTLKKSEDSNSYEELLKSVKFCLTLADKKNLKSLALPSIGSGRAGFPKEEAARTILEAISGYFVNVMSSSLKQIYFVLYDIESIVVYTTELANLDA